VLAARGTKRVVRTWGTRPERNHREQRIQRIGEPQVRVSRVKRGLGDTRCVVWGWLDEHRTKHGTPSNLSPRPLFTPMHRPRACRTSPSVSFLLTHYTNSTTLAPHHRSWQLTLIAIEAVIDKIPMWLSPWIRSRPMTHSGFLSRVTSAIMLHGPACARFLTRPQLLTRSHLYPRGRTSPAPAVWCYH
jgi:hypothetical protein